MEPEVVVHVAGTQQSVMVRAIGRADVFGWWSAGACLAGGRRVRFLCHRGLCTPKQRCNVGMSAPCGHDFAVGPASFRDVRAPYRREDDAQCCGCQQ
jgi:hypothetical protein